MVKLLEIFDRHTARYLFRSITLNTLFLHYFERLPLNFTPYPQSRLRFISIPFARNEDL